MSKNQRPLSRRSFLGHVGAAAAATTAATYATTARAQATPPIKIRVAYQFGLVYAPILLMKELGTIKRYDADAVIEFSRVATGGVIRDQFIAGQLDIGVLGPPPFLIGWQYLDWKYVVGTGIFPFKLVTWRDDIKTLHDFKPQDKIALPGLGSLQHILLAMAAEKQLGNAHALDRNIITLPHPDATASILSKNPNVVAHFANIPFLFRELDAPFVHVVLDGFDAFGGPFMSPLAFTDPKFLEANPLAMAMFVAAYNDAVAVLNLDPQQAAKVLAPQFKETPEVMHRWLTWPGITFTSLSYGILGWHDFMLKAGYIKKGPKDLADVCSPQLLAWIGLEAGKGENPVQKLQGGHRV